MGESLQFAHEEDETTPNEDAEPETTTESVLVAGVSHGPDV